LEQKTLLTSGVRTVAVFEALKGVLVLVAGFGLLSLVHRDLEEVAEHLVRISHLNPAYHYPRIFIEAATHTDNNRLKLFAAIAFLYSSLRFIEAYGLWRARAWAEWFAIISGGAYLPFEIMELVRKPTFIRAGVLIVNAIIVLYLIYVRWTNHKEKTNIADSAAIPDKRGAETG
jgi:uncharacterized membrane protein (DUF2068 family)